MKELLIEARADPNNLTKELPSCSSWHYSPSHWSVSSSKP